MRSRGAKIAVAVAALAAIVVLFVVLSGGDDDGGSTTTKTATQTTGATGATGKQGSGTAQQETTNVVVVKDGKPVGGVKELDYKKGDTVRFTVRSDVSDEVHLHGYDIMKDVEAGGSVKFVFPADLEGVFEAELESRKEQIVELKVNP